LFLARGESATYVFNAVTLGAFPDDGNWHHLAIVCDLSLADANAKLAIDGIFGSPVNKDGSPSTSNPAYPLTIGGYKTTGVFNGWIDELRISDGIWRWTSDFTPSSIAYVNIIELTPSITSADSFQSIIWDISAVSDVNKDAIDSIIFTTVNADEANTFYIDNMYTDTALASLIKKVSGVVQASILKINGVAIASIKKVLGVANIL
jgi:hypothetical protein